MIHKFEAKTGTGFEVGFEVHADSLLVELFVTGDPCEPYENYGSATLTAAEAFKLSTELFRAALKIKRHEDNKENN